MKNRPSQFEIRKFIVENFYRNYEVLKLEGGNSLAPQSRQQAIEQILMYYERLQDIAETVTDTEIKLTLPEQKSPKGNKFTIEGIVDIVRDDQRTDMYDLKTHAANYVRENAEQYQKQLNVYAYIWQELRGQELDSIAIIATQVPNAVKQAQLSQDQEKILEEMQKWEPLVKIPFSQEDVHQTINEFGEVVDKINDGAFQPASVKKLRERIKGSRSRFATQICRNCDARFSCNSYREFQIKYGMGTSSFSKYFTDLGLSNTREEWTSANSTDKDNPIPNDISDEIN